MWRFAPWVGGASRRSVIRCDWWWIRRAFRDGSRVAPAEPTDTLIICRRTKYADVAQLVAHNLAKVGVAGSNPVVRSRGAEGTVAVDSVSWWAFIAGMLVGGQILLGLRWAFRSDRGRREPD